MRYVVTLGDRRVEVEVERTPTGDLDLRIDGRRAEVDAQAVGRALSLRVDGRVVDLVLDGTPPEVSAQAGARRLLAAIESDRGRRGAGAAAQATRPAEGLVLSPMPGRVLKVLVSEGEVVASGAAVVVVEAMKMENELFASRGGTVSRVFVAPGDAVEGGSRLLEIT